MSSTSSSGDLTFKSTSEIKSFVRKQLEKPGLSKRSSQADNDDNNFLMKKSYDGTFTDLKGTDIL